MDYLTGQAGVEPDGETRDWADVCRELAVPVVCLRLGLTDGRRVQLFGRSGHEDLDWVAWRLRQALRLPKVPAGRG